MLIIKSMSSYVFLALLILMVLIIMVFTHGFSINLVRSMCGASDVDCFNSGSSLCDSITVEAWISGSNPQVSSGGGSADGDVLMSGCCVIAATARVYFSYHDPEEGVWISYPKILEFDGRVSKIFYPAGDATATEVKINLCDNVKPSVMATLSGSCVR